MHRVEISLKSHLPDARGAGLVKDIRDLGITAVTDARVVDIYWLDADLPEEPLESICRHLLADPVTQDYTCSTPAAGFTISEPEPPWHAVEVAYNAGVADPVEETVLKAIRDLGVTAINSVKTAKRYFLKGKLDNATLETISNRLLVNPIVEHVVTEFHFPENPSYDFELKYVDITAEAATAGLRREFGFSDDEIRTIIEYFQNEGRQPTDAELETLAQTWSEHCGRKTFQAKISLDGQTIDNLL